MENVDRIVIMITSAPRSNPMHAAAAGSAQYSPIPVPLPCLRTFSFYTASTKITAYNPTRRRKDQCTVGHGGLFRQESARSRRAT